MKKYLLISLFVFCSTLNAYAEEVATITPVAQQDQSDIKIKDKPSISESDIPVNLEAHKKTAQADSPWVRMIMMLIVVGGLSFGALIFIRRTKNKNGAKTDAPEIKVLTQHYLGPKKSLAIIRVAGESILVGVTDQNISLIKELSLLDEDIPTNVPKDFNQSLEDAEDFSMSGIKDFVSTKLKNMRTIQ